MARSTPRRRAEPARRARRRSRRAAPPATTVGGSPVLTRSRTRSRLFTSVAALLTLLGLALLVAGIFDLPGLERVDTRVGPTLDLTASWPTRIGAVTVATTYVWALAARTGGRPVVFSLLTVAVGVVVLWWDLDVLRNGAAVMTCVVSAVLAVVATVPAVRARQVVREVLVATLVAAVGGLATVGLDPDIDVVRFEYITLALSLVGALGLIYRLGAGLHGLGRRGLVVVVVGTVLLAMTLVYAELLARYGTPMLVERVFDGLRWLRDTIGASPRPIVALLGVPALAWGTHMRARRRQGWWVCAFGVGATSPVAQALIDPGMPRQEAALAIGYGVAVGLLVGVVLIRLDLALTGPRGRRARRAEEAGAHRPEPSRIEALL